MKKITGKPDVSAFLEGGKAEERRQAPAPAPAPAPAVAKAPAPQVAAKPAKEKPQAVEKRQKLVELPRALYDGLKDRAYEDYKRTGVRVTETEIIVAALSKYLNIEV